MKYIVILAAVLFVALYYIMAEVIWQLRNRTFRHRIIIGVLVTALLVSQTSIVNLFTRTDAESAAAAEAESTGIITISDFAELPDDIREQTVPVGTALEELVLPDTLEAVCGVADDDVDADEGADTDPDADTDEGTDIGDGANANTDIDADADDGTDTDVDVDEGADADTNIGDDTDADAGADTDEGTDTDTDTDTDIDAGNDTDTNADTYTDADVTTDNNTSGDIADTESDTEKAETFSVTMPEYQTENIIEVKTLEADSLSGNSDEHSEDSKETEPSVIPETSKETITIENITWQSEPEYNGDVEGEYIFTAVLPDGYVLTDTVDTPQVVVTVGETDNIALMSGEGIMLMAATHSHSGWTATSSLPSSSGSYYLTDSVSGSWTAPSGTTNLCLNGETINGMITVPSGATLYIYDESGGKVSNSGNIMQVNSGGKAYINGGTYENTANSAYGIIVNGYLQIDDGTIKGAPKSATIAVRGEVVINQADVSGPSNAVSAESSGKAYIYGGTFSSSSATTMAAAANAYMYINMTNGGTITNSVSGRYAITVTGTADIVYANTSGSSTSVNVNSGAVAEINAGSFNSTSSDTVNNSGTLTITGGTFKASSSYNVVNISSGTTTITGGTFTGGKYAVNNSGTFKLSGKPSFSGSTADIYLPSNQKITITGTLSNTAPYSISMEDTPTSSSPVEFTTGTTTYNDNTRFTSANSSYIVRKNSSSQLELAVPPAHTHDNITFTPWTSGNSLPSSSGSYYLTGNVSLSGTWTAPSGTTNLCLNGHDITFSSGYVSVGSGSTLNIYDCQDQGTITGVSYGISISNGNVTVNGGKITATSGSGIYISGTSTLTVHGGTITTDATGGSEMHGIYTNNSSCTLTIDGGTVTTAKAGEATIYVYGSDNVFISGGTICNDNTNSGCLYIGTNSSATITGGTMRGTLYGVRNLGTTSITGATVIGGVDGLRNSGTITIKGGSFSGGTTYGINSTGSMNLSGSPTITGGTADIYLGSGKYITVTGTLSNTTPYSVATYTNPTASTPIVITNSSTTSYNDNTKFTSANSSYIVRKNSSSQLELAVPVTYYTITYAPGTGTDITGTVPSGTKIGGEDFTLSNQTFARTGYTQDGWTTTDGGEKIYNLGGTYTADRNITLYPHWTANTWTVTYDYQGATGNNSTASKSVTYDSTYGDLPTPTRAGYTFIGWYTEANGNGNKVESTTKVTIDNSHKLYAYWEDDIAPIIGELTYNYTPKTVNGWVIGKDKLVITVPVTEEGSGVSKITYTVTPEGKVASTETAALATTTNTAIKEATITVNADFKGTIKIDCQDAAENQAASKTVGSNGGGVIVEDNAPTVSFEIGGNAVSGEIGYYDVAPDVKVTVTDDADNAISGGIASVTYQVGGRDKKPVEGNFTADIVTKKEFTIPSSEINTGIHIIAVKVEDNAGNTAEAILTVKVKGSEETPEASVDRPNEKITGLVPGAEYGITYTDKDGKLQTDKVKADENGNLEIEDDWLGKSVDIVKKGNGSEITDSLPQSLAIPEREPAPTDAKMSKKAGKNGKGGSIGGLTPGETYQISRDGGETWEDVTADEEGEIKPIEAGSYDIRKKAGDNTLPSNPVHVKVTKQKDSGSGGSTGGGGGNGNDGSDSGSGDSDSGGGQPDDDGGNGQTDNTPGDSVTPPADEKTPETNTPPADTPKKQTPKKETSKKEEPKQDTSKTQEESGKPEQSTTPESEPSADTADQTAPTETADDAVEITGDSVATGTIRDAQNTTTTLTVGEGSVSVTVVSDEYQYAAGVKDTVAVVNAVLTPEQKQHVNDGGKIEIRVEVTDISGQVSDEDKDIIESGLTDNKITDDIDGQEQGELTLGAYIDISMYIRVGDGDWDAVTQAGEPIEVVIGIPDELQSEGRTFYIARSHEGDFTLLDDLDTEADTITIRTELFSTYAIVYRQGFGTDTDGANGFLTSLSWTAVALWSLGILVMLGIAIFLIFWKRRKEEEAS